MHYNDPSWRCLLTLTRHRVPRRFMIIREERELARIIAIAENKNVEGLEHAGLREYQPLSCASWPFSYDTFDWCRVWWILPPFPETERNCSQRSVLRITDTDTCYAASGCGLCIRISMELNVLLYSGTSTGQSTGCMDGFMIGSHNGKLKQRPCFLYHEA